MLHCFGLAGGLRRVNEDDVNEARAYMVHKAHQGHNDPDDVHADEWDGEVWRIDDVERYKLDNPGRCVILLHGFVVDATGYLAEHPGGVALLRRYSACTDGKNTETRDATWAFDGGLNNHSRTAKKRMRALRVAKYRV